MAGPLNSEIPKFKAIERRLRKLAATHRDVAELLSKARANPKERHHLDAAREECEQALQHIRQAIHRLYDACEPPKTK